MLVKTIRRHTTQFQPQVGPCCPGSFLARSMQLYANPKSMAKSNGLCGTHIVRGGGEGVLGAPSGVCGAMRQGGVWRPGLQLQLGHMLLLLRSSSWCLLPHPHPLPLLMMIRPSGSSAAALLLGGAAW